MIDACRARSRVNQSEPHVRQALMGGGAGPEPMALFIAAKSRDPEVRRTAEGISNPMYNQRLQ